MEKLLQRHGVKTVFRLTQSIQQHLKLAKNARDPLASGGVFIRRVFIGTMKHRARMYIAEHTQAC